MPNNYINNGNIIIIGISVSGLAIVGFLIKIYLPYLLKKSAEKQREFFSDTIIFRNAFIDFVECLESKTIGLNSNILSEFSQHRRAKDIFIHNLKGLRRWRFNKKWAEYEEEYKEVANRDPFTRYAAIAPNREALGKATHLDAEQWELDRKKKIHHILNQIFKISKRKIWL